MRKFLFKSLLWVQCILVLIGITTGELSASWGEMTVEELVRSSELVVIGKLISLRSQPNGQFEVGTIKVEEVIVDRKDLDLMEVSLVVPARDRKIRISTDIVYQEGQRGLWFLRIKPGSNQGTGNILYLADHPQRFQSAENVILIREYLRAHPQL